MKVAKFRDLLVHTPKFDVQPSVTNQISKSFAGCIKAVIKILDHSQKVLIYQVPISRAQIILHNNENAKYKCLKMYIFIPSKTCIHGIKGHNKIYLQKKI